MRLPVSFKTWPITRARYRQVLAKMDRQHTRIKELETKVESLKQRNLVLSMESADAEKAYTQACCDRDYIQAKLEKSMK